MSIHHWRSHCQYLAEPGFETGQPNSPTWTLQLPALCQLLWPSDSPTLAKSTLLRLHAVPLYPFDSTPERKAVPLSWTNKPFSVCLWILNRRDPAGWATYYSGYSSRRLPASSKGEVKEVWDLCHCLTLGHRMGQNIWNEVTATLDGCPPPNSWSLSLK